MLESQREEGAGEHKNSITDKTTIRQSASLAGWSYDGLERERNYYFKYRNIGKGAHATYMRGKFCFSPPRIGCLNERRPWVELRVTWRGTAFEDHGVG